MVDGSFSACAYRSSAAHIRFRAHSFSTFAAVSDIHSVEIPRMAIWFDFRWSEIRGMVFWHD
eukprot:7916852-Pyramimonas_sp.AAC.1